MAALKQDLAAGLADLAAGRYRSYDDSQIMRLGEEIGQSGRERLKQASQKRPA